MQLVEMKWMIIRTIGLVILCMGVYQAYHLFEAILSLIELRSSLTHQYSDGSGSFLASHFDKAAAPIYSKIWLTIREFFVVSIMSYYFLKKGEIAFNLLSSKETSND
ncbi:hypothetical protein [uncultured Pseudoalteromonas sp.]|uniref:hypothetical protein n=1 Tax=unclassified Pseudoalteromonas TaxID=194690 RepID=UPI0030D799D8|tara:strand:+ start:18642 stop:18962 length:321 start_codon:yes stop_codon:yes gene_type:complete